MDPEFDDDRALRDVHRAASDALDERPASRVRAAVLAEAAKVARTRRARPFVVRYWPRSLAAVLVVSVMTGLVVTHGWRDEPARGASVVPSPMVAGESDRPAPVPETAPPAVADGSPPPAAQSSAQSLAKTIPPVARKPAPRPAGERATPTPVPEPSDEAPGSPAAQATDAQATDARSARAIASTPSPGADALDAAAAPAPAEPSDETRSMARTRMAMAARGSENADAATRLRKAELPPARRLERILALRRAGSDDEADRELLALRADFPDFALPPEAFRSTAPR